MKRILFYIVVFLFTLTVDGQENTKFISFEFGYDYHSYKMKELNHNYLDSLPLKAYSPIYVLENVNIGSIKGGQGYRLAIRFQPLGFFDIGGYLNYQYSLRKGELIFTDKMGKFEEGENAKIKGESILKTDAIGFGGTGTFYISQLLKFQEKENALNRLHIGLELSGGMAYSKIRLIDRAQKPDDSWLKMTLGYYNKTKGFQGQIGFKIEYDFVKSPIFITLGIRGGYQYYRTQPLKTEKSENWIRNGEEVVLDYSGFYGGIYLKLGR